MPKSFRKTNPKLAGNILGLHQTLINLIRAINPVTEVKMPAMSPSQATSWHMAVGM